MVEVISFLDVIRFFTGFSILFYASYTDIKTRTLFEGKSMDCLIPRAEISGQSINEIENNPKPNIINLI